MSVTTTNFLKRKRPRTLIVLRPLCVLEGDEMLMGNPIDKTVRVRQITFLHMCQFLTLKLPCLKTEDSL